MRAGNSSSIGESPLSHDRFLNPVTAALDSWKSSATEPSRDEDFSVNTQSSEKRAIESPESLSLFIRYHTVRLAIHENMISLTNGHRNYPQYSGPEPATLSLETARTMLVHLNTAQNGLHVFQSLFVTLDKNLFIIRLTRNTARTLIST